MSKVRNKYLKRAGIINKTDMNKCRKSCKGACKSNIRYYINNYGFILGMNDSFIMQSS